MSIVTMRRSHCLIAKCHVSQSWLIGEATEVVQLLAFKFVLYAFTIWRIANQGEDGTDAFNQKYSLRGIGIVQGSLSRVDELRIKTQENRVPVRNNCRRNPAITSRGVIGSITPQ